MKYYALCDEVLLVKANEILVFHGGEKLNSKLKKTLSRYSYWNKEEAGSMPEDGHCGGSCHGDGSCGGS